MLLTVEGAGELHTDLTTVIDGFTAFEHALPYELHDDVVQLLARAQHVLHADAHRRVRRPRGRGLLLSADAIRTTTRSCGASCRIRCSTSWRGGTRGSRSTSIHFPTVASSAAAVRPRGRHRLAGRARAAAGPRRALGVVGAGRRGQPAGRTAMTPFEALQGVDARRRARRLGFAARPRHGRDRQARGPRRPRRGPAGRHPQQREDPLGDQERRALRRGRRWRGDGRRSARCPGCSGRRRHERHAQSLRDRSRRSQRPRVVARDSEGDRDDRRIARRRGVLEADWRRASGRSPRSWSTWRRPRSIVQGRFRYALATDSYVVQPFDQDLFMAVEPAVDGDAALAAYVSLRRFALPLIDRLSADELAKRFRHPDHGEISVAWLLAWWAGHERRHLGQIERIAAR